MKLNYCLFLLLILIIICTLTSNAQIKLDTESSWNTLFEDEFTNYNSINDLLNEYILDDQRCKTFFELSPQTVEINQGILSLKAIKNNPTCNDSLLNYTGLSLKYGSVYSPPECSHIDQQLGFRYGLFEIRCKLPKDDFKASFWLYNNAEEWNIIESIGSGLPTNVHDYPGGEDTDSTLFPQSTVYNNRRTCGVFVPIERDLTEYYHTYSFMWDYDNRTLTWFFDGREIRTETRQEIFTCNHPFIFGITQGLAFAEQGQFDIDYVRVLGLNAPTDLYRYKYISSSLPQDKEISSEPDALALGNAEWIFYRNFQDNISSLRLVNGNYVHASITLNDHYQVDGDVVVGSGNTVFYRGADDQLHIVSWDGTDWNDDRIDGAYISDLFGGALASNLSTGGGNHVFFRNPRGWMSHYYKHPTNGWVFGNVISNFDLDHRVNGDVVVGDNGQVFYVGSDNRIQMYSWTSTNGWSHYYVDDYWSTDDYKASSNSGALKIANGTLYYRGLDNKVHTFSYDHVTQNWVNEVLPFEIPEDYVGGEIALPKGQDEEVYFIGADGYIQHCFLYKNHWLHRWVDERIDSTPSENKPNGVDLAAFFNAENKNIVYVRDDNLRIFKDLSVSYGELENLVCNDDTGTQSSELSFREEEDKNSVDTHEDVGNHALTIIPNPALRGSIIDIILNFEALHPNTSSRRKALISIFDSSGRLVSNSRKEALIESNQNSGTKTYSLILDSSHLSGGLYTLVLTLSDSGTVMAKRFVIQ
jgi:hypothetical protein